MFEGEELFQVVCFVKDVPRVEDLCLCAGAVFIVWVIVEKFFEGGVVALWATGKESARVSVKRGPAERVKCRREGFNGSGVERGSICVVCKFRWGG